MTQQPTEPTEHPYNIERKIDRETRTDFVGMPQRAEQSLLERLLRMEIDMGCDNYPTPISTILYKKATDEFIIWDGNGERKSFPTFPELESYLSQLLTEEGK